MEAKDNKENLEEIKENTNVDNEVKTETNVINEAETHDEENHEQSHEEKHEPKDAKSKKKMFGSICKKIIIVAILLLIVIFILDTSKYYKNNDIVDRTNVIINNSNVTARLKEDVIIEDDVIFMSLKDIRNFFDYYIYEEENENMIITTYDENIAEVGFTGNYININEIPKRVNAVAIDKDGITYLPISEMINVYNIEIEYIENTDIVTIDSIKKEQIKAEASKNISVKDYARVLSRTVDKVQKGDSFIVIQERNDGWTKVRTENGKIGFVRTNSLDNTTTVREEQITQKQVEGKVNMFWDYYSEYKTAPNRNGEDIEGVNVVSPTFFYIDSQGNFQDKVGQEGKQYIQWAHKNGIKVWAMISNTEAQNTKKGQDSSNILKVTSQIMNSYELRKGLINSIVEACEKYNLDGINIDFEYMYEKDKDLFSRFIIELQPRMQNAKKVLSVDVTAPDGSPNWSLCFDRTVIANSVDYIIFMAYDQVGGSNATPGTTAGCNWVENNIIKFINNCDVEPEKLVLGIPFYTRLWTQTSDGKVSSKAVTMNKVESELPSSVTKTWDDDLKQYYVQYKEGSKTMTMWIEDNESLKEKVSLVNKYNLAGVSAWQKDQESEDTFEMIKEVLESGKWDNNTSNN